ncbi:MAG: formate/nitrite transporter family protein [Nitrospirae bacterium]|nr:formate/nitrite transporter family protein [Nitrospirota bacterium]
MPTEIAGQMLTVGAAKANLPPKQLLVCGMLAGPYLSIATGMAVTAAVQTGQWIVVVVIFPFGLGLVMLLGAELITGSFALLPLSS